MVSSAVTFLTVLTVSAAFLNYSQSFYTQAGIRGGQASLRQSHLTVIRNLRMAGYGMEPKYAFDFPSDWMRASSRNNNMSNRLVFRMRNPSFNAVAQTVTNAGITLKEPLKETLRQGQLIQVMCEGAAGWGYARLTADSPVKSSALTLSGALDKFPNTKKLEDVECFKPSSNTRIYVFKIDVYDYSIRFIDDRPYLFRQHGLGATTSSDPYGEPVAEDIEAFRVTFLREDGTPFIPDPTADAPEYDTPVTVPPHPWRTNRHPANIRAVIVGMVARSSTRDLSTTTSNSIPAFSKSETGVAAYVPSPSGGPGPQSIPLEPEITLDRGTGKPLAPGIRRVVSEMTVQVRNMRSSAMSVPLYSLEAGACKGGGVPSNDYNCAGG
ncbi:PilW family protein [Cystobacter ferrugineus]|uniref:Pilus assembly protein PilW n=1 Tax=Cystobacter ferrugineus TaxID=83449 RepID=A0A1L9BIU1_9BACT|nr:PilW family protein [Cystobacter ferrugineus]OJH42135.1 hypothetical protein BON30_02650 [Cystobacter ferrugineus]